MSSTVPNRGTRNHNPLNIRKCDQWLGQDVNKADKEFVVFSADVFGYRAAFIIIRNYIKKYRANTPAKIIRRWAPPTENDTAQYLAIVTARSRLHPDIPLAFEDSTRICALVSAMAWVESNATPSPQLLATAYGMAAQR